MSFRDADADPRLREAAVGTGRQVGMDDPFDISSLLSEFRQEARQQLDFLDSALVRLEEAEPFSDSESTDLLRVLHTLKGNSAMMGLKPIADQVHAIENVFKAGAPTADRQQIDLLFELSAAIRTAVDHLGGPEEEAALRRVREVDLKATPTSAPTHEPVVPRSPTRAAHSTPEAPQPTADFPAGSDTEILRVPFSKLDDLLADVGELITLHARLADYFHRNRALLASAGVHRELDELTQHLGDMASELRGTTMDLRLVPLRTIFGRFPSLVRELARGEGKRATVEITGESIEVDKSAADALAEPLLHLVRNAVDHGIEGPEPREQTGKDPIGTVAIHASREGDHIRIDVTDDGSGLSRESIVQRAAELGIPVPENAHELIFAPGFSTRREATTISGRGLGLDIVRQSIARLRGSLTVEERDPGTAFILRVPLTLAIVPALIFESQGEILALPTSDVRETLTRRPPERAAGADVIRHQEELIPVAEPWRLFGWDQERASLPSFPILVRRGERSAAIPADRLLDQRNVVVTGLPAYLGVVRGVAGATVAADGRVILLLDSDAILDMNLNPLERSRRVK